MSSHLFDFDQDIYKEYGFNEDKLIRSISDNRENLYSEVIKHINSLNKNYKQLLARIFKENKAKILNLPSIHKIYLLRGGYIKQICNVLKLSKKIYQLYKELDFDIVTSGIIIKHIGLINYYEDDVIHTITEDNENLGYELLGVNIVNDYANSYAKFPVEIKTKLQKIVMSEEFSNDLEINYINSLYSFEHSVYSSINIEN